MAIADVVSIRLSIQQGRTEALALEVGSWLGEEDAAKRLSNIPCHAKLQL
jgi:hypothetical protein